MTDEEMAEEYAEKIVRHKMAVHCIFNEKVTKKEIKDAVIYGLKAGKDMAEADLASVAYMQGAERYKPKWHKVADGDLPKENKLYLVEVKDNGLAIAYFNGLHWETRYNLGDFGHCVETVIAWYEIPKYKEER